jgi:CubicO group peptidase (beta-lactamase class C family)
MHLKDSPSQYLDYSTTRTTELDSVTVEMLLSFTSGFRGTSLTVPCSSDGDTTIAACAQEIAETLFTFAPNTTFFYGPAHFQILAAMAQNATGQSWQAIFESRVGQVLGMASTEYITPSRSNPRVSGGAILSANDMDAFLRAMLIQDPNFLSPDLWNIMLQDHTQSDSIRMLYTPIQAYPFHYGLGVWRECTARITKTFDSSCEPITIVSVTGATGVHGWVDYNNSYYGLIMADLGLSGGSKVLGFSVESLRKNVLADLADAAPPAGSIPTTPPLPTSAPVAPPNNSGGSAIWSTSLSELVLMLVIFCLCR